MTVQEVPIARQMALVAGYAVPLVYTEEKGSLKLADLCLRSSQDRY